VLAVLVLGGLFLTLRPGRQAPAEHTFDLNIRGNTMSPSELSVREGDQVTLRITSDHELELHIHGVDKEVTVRPGQTETLQFEATPSGGWPIEDHDTDTGLGRLNIQPREGG
jgi:cytochrome c oxidase assembly protein Cox11